MKIKTELEFRGIENIVSKKNNKIYYNMNFEDAQGLSVPVFIAQEDFARFNVQLSKGKKYFLTLSTRDVFFNSIEETK